MIIETNKSLLPYNTFRIDVMAKYFVEITSQEDLLALIETDEFKSNARFVLGGGSNLLLTKDFDGIVIRLGIKGISVEENSDDIFVKAGAAEVWNDFVQFNVNKGYAGLENLSLIPGTVGACPIQNIGAYGVEVKDTIVEVEAFHLASASIQKFTNAECKFAYRESIFKNECKGEYIILSVTFKLSKTPSLKLHYGAIEEELKKRGITNPSLRNVADVVSEIRVSKLPDPSTIGNSGSFFKNPIIEKTQFDELISKHPNLVNFPASEGRVKLAAGWLIEQCDWKGKQIGHVGTWKNQALVIVNHGDATGKEIYDFSALIIQSVFERFGVSLEREVNIL
jgi:UDP-N-acetylmuramate dehydrogenase